MPELTRDSIARDGCPALFDVRVIESPQTAEVYINVRFEGPLDDDDQIAAVYAHLAAILREHAAHVFSERVFIGGDAAASIGAIRRDALGDLDDGVPPTMLVTPPSNVPIHGIQIHGVRARERPVLIEHDGAMIGRRIALAGRSWAHLAALTAPDVGSPPSQASEVYERAVRILRELDMDFNCVARTWVWLRDILGWYPQFNEARTAVFGDEGLVATADRARFLPASTGIGVAPADGGACGLELIAISDGGDSIRSSHAAGEQCSAFAYGSAFARAVVAPTLVGRALLVSGTAAIDPGGVSEHPGDIRAQIDATLRHIRSLIVEAEWTEHQIVSAIAYCKTREVAGIFAQEWAGLDWPRIELIADVCRDELLFEMEVTACDRT